MEHYKNRTINNPDFIGVEKKARRWKTSHEHNTHYESPYWIRTERPI